MVAGCVSVEEIATELRRLSNWYEKQSAPVAAKKDKAKAADEEIEEEEETESEEEETEEESEESNEEETEEEEESEEEEEEEEIPAKGKKLKLTLDDVNKACKTAAKNTSRAAVLKLLKKKFQVASVSDLEPAQYKAVIAALSA